jgi:DNA-binding IscR family transcriptional regulator
LVMLGTSETGKRVLSALLIVGAQSRDQAEPTARLAVRLEVDVDGLEKSLGELQKKGYVVMFEKDGSVRVYLTSIGIVTASSTYS